MIVKKHKAILYCEICECKTVLEHGESDKDENGILRLDCGNNCNFSTSHEFTKDEWEEYLYFEHNKLWKDDSSGNYVAWKMELKSANIIVNRCSPANAGLYDITKVDSNISSNSDPFGKNPHIWKNKKTNLTLDNIKKEMSKYLRVYKLDRILTK